MRNPYVRKMLKNKAFILSCDSFRSSDLRVMSPARFRCATQLVERSKGTSLIGWKVERRCALYWKLPPFFGCVGWVGILYPFFSSAVSHAWDGKSWIDWSQDTCICRKHQGLGHCRKKFCPTEVHITSVVSQSSGAIDGNNEGEISVRSWVVDKVPGSYRRNLTKCSNINVVWKTCGEVQWRDGSGISVHEGGIIQG